MREWLVRLIDWFRRDTLGRELAEELRFHERQLERDMASRGAAAEDARYAAKRQMGNTTRVSEAARERWSIPALDTLLQDARYAVRGLRRAPAFAATVVVTLGLGIGANAAMFDVVDRLMFRPMAHLRDPGTVHRIYLQTNRDGRPFTSSWLSAARYRDLQAWTTSFSQMAAFNERSLAVGTGDDARERRVAAVSASYFGFFDAPPVLGRYFTADEDSLPRGADVIVLSHALWQSEFGSRRSVLGEVLQVGSVRVTIIGVAPKDFAGVSDFETPLAFIPIASAPRVAGGPVPVEGATGYGWLWGHVLARRKPGVTVEQASRDVGQAFVRSWEAEREAVPRQRLDPTAVAQPRGIVSGVRLAAGPDPSLESRTALWLGGVAVIVLLIACANVANLSLARMLRRQRETAVRVSLGATRARLTAQCLTEGFVLAAAGAAGGLLVARWAGAAIHRLLVPNGAGIPSGLVDWRTLAVTVVLALAVGLLIGIVPAVLGGRHEIAMSLRAGSRGGVSHRTRLRAGLLIAQSALSVALLVGAVLFVRSLDAVKAMRMGYDADRVLLVRRVLRGTQLDAEGRAALRRTLMATAQSLPAVEYASSILTVPLGTSGAARISVPGVDSVARLGQFTFQEATPDYFRVMGTRILRGRAFTDGDRRGAPLVVVVSAAMADVLWPGQDALGKCVRMGADTLPCTTVVGVAENIVQNSIAGEDRFHFYVPLEQGPTSDGTGMLLRLRGDPAVEGESVRKALQQVMPGASYVTVRPMRELVDTARRPWHLGATLFVAFGALALVVAGVGLYGVIGYNVTQRMHELGVRAALGARRSDILRLVVGQSVRLTVVGIILGSALALAASRWLQPLLFQQSAKDPVVFASVGLMLLLVAVVASASPAGRAAKADPNLALRSE